MKRYQCWNITPSTQNMSPNCWITKKTIKAVRHNRRSPKEKVWTFYKKLHTKTATLQSTTVNSKMLRNRNLRAKVSVSRNLTAIPHLVLPTVSSKSKKDSLYNLMTKTYPRANPTKKKSTSINLEQANNSKPSNSNKIWPKIWLKTQ